MKAILKIEKCKPSLCFRQGEAEICLDEKLLKEISKLLDIIHETGIDLLCSRLETPSGTAKVIVMKKIENEHGYPYIRHLIKTEQGNMSITLTAETYRSLVDALKQLERKTCPISLRGSQFDYLLLGFLHFSVLGSSSLTRSLPPLLRGVCPRGTEPNLARGRPRSSRAGELSTVTSQKGLINLSEHASGGSDEGTNCSRYRVCDKGW